MRAVEYPPIPSAKKRKKRKKRKMSTIGKPSTFTPKGEK